jgi:hypothetical protein
MTSSVPRDDWFLDALRRAGAEGTRPLSADRLHDIAQSRRLTPAQRLLLLDDMMLALEAAGIQRRVEEPIHCGELRL